MIKLRDLRKEVHDNTLRCRSIESIVQSARFERLWEESTDRQKEEAEFAVWKGSKPELMKWMKNHSSLELGERSLTYLKDRAKKLRVKNYSRLTKPELIGAINRKEIADEQE